jgi:hypothetical protein
VNVAIAGLIVCLAAAASAQDAVGTRIAQSASAAEGLQGGLDGAWALLDARGRTLFIFQIGDPPTTAGPLTCAWRAPDGALGVAACHRRGRSLTIAFEAAGRRRFVLHPSRGGVWQGEFIGHGAGQPVTLRRG